MPLPLWRMGLWCSHPHPLASECKKFILLTFMVALPLSVGKLQQLPPPLVVMLARTYDILALPPGFLCLSSDSVLY